MAHSNSSPVTSPTPSTTTTLSTLPAGTSFILIMQMNERPLSRVDTWPNASTSYQEFSRSRCNGCAAAAGTIGAGVVSRVCDADDNLDGDEVTSRLQGDGPIEPVVPLKGAIGGSQPINLDVLRSTPHHTCAGHYATADAQFKVGQCFYSILISLFVNLSITLLSKNCTSHKDYWWLELCVCTLFLCKPVHCGLLTHIINSPFPGSLAWRLPHTFNADQYVWCRLGSWAESSCRCWISTTLCKQEMELNLEKWVLVLRNESYHVCNHY